MYNCCSHILWFEPGTDLVFVRMRACACVCVLCIWHCDYAYNYYTCTHYVYACVHSGWNFGIAESSCSYYRKVITKIYDVLGKGVRLKTDHCSLNDIHNLNCQTAHTTTYSAALQVLWLLGHPMHYLEHYITLIACQDPGVCPKKLIIVVYI